MTFDAAVEAAGSSEPKPPGQAMKRSSTTATAAQRSDDYFVDRKRIFKDNRLPQKKAKSIFELAWLAYNDKVLILLTVAAVISLALGIYQSIRRVDGESVQWVEGVAIMVAIVIVVIVGAANDWQKERCGERLGDCPCYQRKALLAIRKATAAVWTAGRL